MFSHMLQVIKDIFQYYGEGCNESKVYKIQYDMNKVYKIEYDIKKYE